MAAQASWASEAPVINLAGSFEIENARLENVALDSDELHGSGLPRIVGNSAALRARSRHGADRGPDRAPQY